MSHPSDPTQSLESRALRAGMAGNLFMGAAGVLAAYLSNSQAILVDGLFSLVGFFAALIGTRVSRNAQRQPDKYRPFGYAGDEALFSTFRAMSLLGLVLFAMVSAAMNIVSYANGAPPTELLFAPMAVYFLVVGSTSFGLWFSHQRAWRRTRKTSEILRLEGTAAAFDGIITLAAAVGLFAVHYFRDGVLAPIAPVGDSLIVLALCSTVIVQYYKDFTVGLGELAGVTARPQAVAKVRRAIRQTIKLHNGLLVDLSVSKLGRLHTVVAYLDPQGTTTAEQIDKLTHELQRDIEREFVHVEVHVVVSKHGRVLPRT
ncbi:cation transporter [Ruegeria sp. PrR005]|uniref:Cation transporter n=1 Tax=Ruegeria sp. PrR005 TaxID=2706882 RepID=A0A6B2NJM1_9RHOB|nr:cation transporter [Ruegeria sp. PrR005]NDW44176.1 cation transporter [Ruegeria sp. PrR005]